MKYSKITISGKICTGKSTLFKSLQAKLGWPVFSAGTYFRQFAAEHGINLNAAEEQKRQLTLRVDGMIANLLKQPGNLLVDSWMAGIMADSYPGILKILLVAENSIRFRRFADREDLNLKDAEKQVIERDSSWFAKVSSIHGRKDIFDTKNYDLVIDTSSQTPDQILNTVIQKLNKK